jgi:hypothetical protein
MLCVVYEWLIYVFGLICLICVKYEVDEEFEKELMPKCSKENLIGKLAYICGCV